jgi:hypothetical protein
MLYNNQTLEKYCDINNIKLLEDYSNKKITRDNCIQGICITKECNKLFNKSFRQLIQTGAYCYDCAIENGKQKQKDKCKYNYSLLKVFCNDNNIILNRVYDSNLINRDTVITGNCINKDCENIFNRSFRELIKLNGYCLECCKEIGKNKIKETNIERFGYDNAMKNDIIKEKQKNTVLEKYGVEHISQLDKIKEKKKEKSLEKYGTEFVLQAEEVKNKSKETNIIKYGYENPQQNKDIQNKSITTNLKSYGEKYYFQTECFKNKAKISNLIKYGVEHHSQNAEVSELILKNTYKTKKYTLPSGKIINYQGYENFALDELLNIENILEEDIITNRKDVPEIWYFDNSNKKRRHFVDLFIKSQNRCIEIKSTWTNQAKNYVLEKQKAAVSLGYKYEIWIFDRKGIKLNAL